jgi:protein-S-isoprenylcysteine O-methyltransferase Ste14
MPRADAKPSGIRIIPPLVVLGAVVVASVVDWFMPLGFGLPPILRWILGAVLIIGPLAMMPSIFAAFRRADSAYDVRVVPKRLVTEGAFGYSRNPGYAGLIILGVGLAILFDNPWTILALVPTAIVIHREVILKEEDVLEHEFGDEYRAYKHRVRRWL